MTAPLAALVPVKSFAQGKSRLEPALTDDERATLTEKLATSVIEACAPLPTYVACESDTIAIWAQAHRATPIRSNMSGLNNVVQHAVAALGAEGYERVLVAHGDLADPRNLPLLGQWEGVVLVPDRHLDGTNVLIVAADVAFRFSYGPGSFARHVAEAERIGLPVHVIDDPGLALDLDSPEDLQVYSATRDRPPVPPTLREQ